MVKINAYRHRFHYLILLCLVLLSACTHISRNDGPPDYYVDAAKVPNAIPKAEPQSKYGNPRTYSVFGKRYYTMKSSKNYEAVGIASWYGTKFHKQRTSSGERYNMLAMTAAHKTLPLPTYAEVTNLQNHRSVIVKINDRGPFEGNRIIDLSYVAAKKLGVTGRGTALVKVKAIDPVAYWNTYASTEKSSHHFYAPKAPHKQAVYLQVGAFRDRLHAEKLKNRLENYISAPINIAHTQQTKKGLYHVQIGPIKDAATATKINHRLKLIGLKGSALAMSR